MDQENIFFFAQEIEFTLESEESVANWLLSILGQNEQEADCINFIFCSDEDLLQLNREHLDHDYLTDILTFPLSPPDEALMADIYISVDRVIENANTFGVSFRDELHRVMVHGILHLIGYEDGTDADKTAMREQESKALAMRTF